MLEPVQITSNVWVFHSTPAERNCGVVLGDSGALLVDPSNLPGEGDDLERFVSEAGCEVEAVAFTCSGKAEQPHVERWPDAARIIPGSREGRAPLPVSIPGWQIVPLGSPNAGRVAIYSPTERVLFCGDMLSDVGIPSITGTSRAYLDAVTAVEELDVKFLVPWRGSLALGKRAIRQRIENDRNYLHSLHRHVVTSLAGGASLDRALQIARQVYEDYPYLEQHLHNLRHMWEEERDA